MSYEESPSTIKKETTTAASTKAEAKKLVTSMEEPVATQPVKAPEAPVALPTDRIISDDEVMGHLNKMRTGVDSQEAPDLNQTIVSPEAAEQADNLEKENERLLVESATQQVKAVEPLSFHGVAGQYWEDQSMRPRDQGIPSPKSYGCVSSNMRMRSQSPVSVQRFPAQHSPRVYPEPSGLQKRLCEARDEAKALKARVQELEKELV